MCPEWGRGESGGGGDTTRVNMKTRWARWAALGLAGCLWGGCTKDNPAYTPPAPVCGEGEQFSQQRFTLPARDKLDILVVADRRQDTVELRRAVGEGLEAALESAPGLDWQIGVTSSDLLSADHNGFLQPTLATERCTASDTRMLRRENSGPGTIACRLETLGAVEEHPNEILAAAERALRRAVAAEASVNSNLLRPDARTLVLLVGGRPDCSGSESSRTARRCLPEAQDNTPVDVFGTFFGDTLGRQRAPLVARPTVAFIGGPLGGAGEATCELGELVVESTPRLRALAHALSDTAWWTSACTSNHEPVLREIIREVHAPGESPGAIPICLSAPLVGAPVSVVVGPEDEGAPLSEIGDYLVEPPGSVCPNGGISLNGERLSPVGGEPLRIRFCRADDGN